MRYFQNLVKTCSYTSYMAIFTKFSKSELFAEIRRETYPRFPFSRLSHILHIHTQTIMFLIFSWKCARQKCVIFLKNQTIPKLTLFPNMTRTPYYFSELLFILIILQYAKVLKRTEKIKQFSRLILKCARQNRVVLLQNLSAEKIMLFYETFSIFFSSYMIFFSEI